MMAVVVLGVLLVVGTVWRRRRSRRSGLVLGGAGEVYRGGRWRVGGVR